jgi:hypothetical protein
MMSGPIAAHAMTGDFGFTPRERRALRALRTPVGI